VIVYTIRIVDKGFDEVDPNASKTLYWSFNKGWAEEGENLPAIYPDEKAAQKALKSTPSKASKPIFTAEFWGWDTSKIEIVPFNFEEM